MKILQDYTCKNESCPEHGKTIELYIKRGTTPKCSACSQDMKTVFVKPHPVHGSWSTWRMME